MPIASDATASIGLREIQTRRGADASGFKRRGAELALRAPGRIKCLALMNTYLGPEPAATRAQYFAMLGQIEVSGAVPAPLLDAIVPLYFRPNMEASSPLFRAFRADLANFSADSLRHGVIPMGRMIFDRTDMRPRLTGLDRDSTLLSCGAQDIPRPPAETQEIAQIIGCRYVSVPDSGHISSLENPAFVTQMLLSEFGKRLPSRCPHRLRRTTPAVGCGRTWQSNVDAPGFNIDASCP